MKSEEFATAVNNSQSSMFNVYQGKVRDFLNHVQHTASVFNKKA